MLLKTMSSPSSTISVLLTLGFAGGFPLVSLINLFFLLKLSKDLATRFIPFIPPNTDSKAPAPSPASTAFFIIFIESGSSGFIANTFKGSKVSGAISTNC